MKLKILVLLLPVLEVFSEFQLRERPSDDIALQAMCAASCRSRPVEAKECEENCFIEHDHNVTAHDVEAKANVKIVCQDYEFVILAVDSEGVFIVETRNQSSDWDKGLVWKYITILPQYIKSENGSQLRFTRADEKGISKSEATELIKPLPRGVEPMKVKNVSLQCLKREGDLITAEISFDPTEERCCKYQMTWRRNNMGRHSMGTTAINVSAPGKIYVLLEHLPFGENFTVSVQPQTSTTIGEETFLSVSTPSYWKSDDVSMICVPDEVQGVDATVNHRVNNIFDVTVTWDSSEISPDFFIVETTSTGINASEPYIRNVSGTYNETVFLGVEISEELIVSIRAWTLAGGSVPISKRFQILRNPSDAEGALTVVGIGVGIVAALSCVGLGLATGVYVYLKTKGRKQYLQSSQSIELKQIKKYKINLNRLEVLRVMGSGSIRVVKLGRLRDDEGQMTNVVVKMLRDDKNERDLNNFRREIKMMKSLGSHPNIVSIVGYHSAIHSPLLIVEYCPRGDLLSFLHATSPGSVTTVNEVDQTVLKQGYNESVLVLEDNPEGTSTPCQEDDDHAYVNTVVAGENSILTVLDMLKFGLQIAAGMAFLSSRRIVHGDLRAKNVFVCDNRVLKISDFGLKRDIRTENNYGKTESGRSSVQWMAMESLMHQIYDTHSDVWSFGVLLWEIVTLGCTPYPGVPESKIMKELESGYRMQRPANCSEPLYNVMMSCWKTVPTDRPTFTVVQKVLEKLIRAAAGDGYPDVDDVSGRMTSEEKN